MYQVLRKLHLSAALFSLIFLVAYTIGAVELAHRKWFSHPYSTIEEPRKMTPGITDARVLAREWRGELTNVENSPGRLKFMVRTPLGKTFDVSYLIASGDTTLRTTTTNFMTTLVLVHVSHAIWAWCAALVSLGLLTLGATGLYLWFKNNNERWVGIVLLLAGLAISMGLVISMRLD
jgi:hypothetical protein